jgi:Cu/Ag efflux protein CusF
VRTLLSPCAAGEEFGYHWWSGNVFVRGKEVRWHAAQGNGGQRLFIVPSLDMVVVMTAGEYDDGSIGRAQRYLLQLVVAATREHAGEAAESSAPSVAVTQEVAPVETRATFRSVTEEDGGARVYVHLKVVPGANLPFTTLRFSVRDKSILAGLREGAHVKFRAERIDGENSLTAIRAVPPCVRFQPCD